MIDNQKCDACSHNLADHGGSYEECDKCDCKHYHSKFGCRQCGTEFSESEVKDGYNLCEPCAKTHNNGNRIIN